MPFTTIRAAPNTAIGAPKLAVHAYRTVPTQATRGTAMSPDLSMRSMTCGNATMSEQQIKNNSDQNTRPLVRFCHTMSFAGAVPELWPMTSHQRSTTSKPRASSATSP